ncbi:MAG: NADH-quinone oxidoreductase subunit [Thermoproteota archaeon]|nr:NADH-quinone oxidoreductase subunit [Thermoproteota archaeon]
MVFDLTFFFGILVFPGLLFILTLALLYDWIERKMAARMQNRMGPSFAGPAGILQPLADYIKLFTKEEIIPEGVNTFIYTLSPIISFSIFVLAILFIPINGLNVFGSAGFEGDLLLIFALATFGSFTIFLSGWSSSNPYSEMGSVRVLYQFLGYDIPTILLAISPAMLAGSLSMTNIVRMQAIPFVFIIPWVFVLFTISMQAELEEDPFDIPHAGTEIVAGYETEFSGGKLAFLNLTRDMQIVFGAAVTVTLFLGGPLGPVLFSPSWLWYTLWFVLKSILVICIIEGIECACARLRIDQVIRGNWKLMIPLSIASLITTIVLRSFIAFVV